MIYEERVTIPAKDIVITSQYIFTGNPSDKINTVIDCSSLMEQDTLCVFFFMGSAFLKQVQIRGLTIKGGKGFKIENNRYGGGFFCENETSIDIACCNITNNGPDAYYGTSIYGKNIDIQIFECGFYENTM